MGGGGKTSQSSSTVSIPPEVLARYNSVNARAEQTATQPFQPYSGEFVAPLSETQQAGIQSTNASAGQAQPYYNAATGLTMSGAKDIGPLTQGQIGYYQNPYTQAVVDPTVKALQQQFGQQNSAQQTQAIKAGGFGSSGDARSRALLSGQQDLALSQAIAPLYQKGFTEAADLAKSQQGVVAGDLARRMQAGQQIAGLGVGAQTAGLQGAAAQLSAGEKEQQTQQALDTAKYQQFLQQQRYPFDVTQFLANIAMGTGALSGSTTQTTSPRGLFGNRGGAMTGERHAKYAGGGLVPEGFDESSMGGAVMPDMEGMGFARGGYADGGVGPYGSNSILSAGTGIVPPPMQHNYKLMISNAKAPEASGGLGDALKRGEQAVGMYKMGKEGLIGTPKTASDPTGGAGLVGGQGQWGGENAFTKIKNWATSTEKAAHGGLIVGREHHSTGNAAGDDYDENGKLRKKEMDNRAEVPDSFLTSGFLQSGAQHPTLQTPGAPSSGGKSSSGIGDIGSALGAGKSAMSLGKSALGGLGELGAGFSSAGNAAGLDAALGPGFFASNIGLGAEGASAAGAGLMGSIGSGLGTAAAGIGSTVAEILPFLAMLSDARAKDNIRPVGETYDGQNIYSYNIGEGPTQMGLMAQEVMERKPEAVGRRGEYLTVDYDRATEDASPFAYGGLVPREHHDGSEGNVVGEGTPSLDTDPTLGLISKFEGFRERPYYDVNALRTGFGSDTVTMPDGRVQRVDKDTRVTVEDAKRDLARRANEFQGHIKGAVGEDAWGKLDPNSQAALTSVTYNYGKLPKSVAQAVASGNRSEIAAAVNALGIHNEGVNAKRRSQEAGLIDPEGKYAPLMMSKDPNAPRPPGLVGETGKQPSGEGLLDKASGLFDKATSPSFAVPALGFLGSMLSSKSRTLAGALGEGMLGGVGAYQSNKKQEQETAKNLVEILGNRFERQLVNGQVVYRNKITGAEVPASQMANTAAEMFKNAGLDPKNYGITPPSAPTAPGLAPAVAPAPAGGAPGAAPAAAPGTPAAPGEAPPAAGAKPLAVPTNPSDMSATQLRAYYEKNPEAAGLVGDDDPRVIRAKIKTLKDRAEDFRSKLNDNAGATEADRQAQVEQARLDGLLSAATEHQSKVNQKLNEQQATQSGKFEEEILKRQELYKRARGNWERLGDIYSELSTGRAETFKADLASWADGFGIPLPNLQQKLANAANVDAATKITMQEVYDAMARENLVRAPAASAKGLSQTVPGPNLTPGAVYEIVGKNLGELEHVRKRDDTYLDQARGTVPAKFLRDYDAKNPSSLKEDVARGLNILTINPNVPRETIDSLYKTYGPHGYDPRGTQAGSAAPAASTGPALPSPLQGKEGLVFSPSRNQYRDAQGNIYDATGKRVQ